jgi:hypothetical protein
MARLLRSLAVFLLSYHLTLLLFEAIDIVAFDRWDASSTTLAGALLRALVAPTGYLTLMALVTLLILGWLAWLVSRLTLAALPLGSLSALAVGLLPTVVFGCFGVWFRLAPPETRFPEVSTIWPILLLGPPVVFGMLVARTRIGADPAMLRPRPVPSSQISSFPQRLLSIVVGLPCLITFFFLVVKLALMLQVIGVLPGRHVSTQAITQRWHQQTPAADDTYWISWDTLDIRTPSLHRLNVTAERWAHLAVGDSVRLYRVPGSSLTYASGDIYTSPGNFAYDILLLCLAVLGLRWAYRQVRPRPVPETVLTNAP